jgi:PadR family transcriptional regulator AphA
VITVGSLSLSLTDWVVLGLVAEESRHGFAVAAELGPGTELGRVWTVRRPLVYRAVDHVEQAGLLVRARTEPGRQGPDRTILRVTPRGRAAVRGWLAQPVAHPRDVRTELLAKFILLERGGLALGPLASRQLACFEPVMAGLDRTADQGAPAGVAGLWRRESMQATIRFLERIAGGALGG